MVHVCSDVEEKQGLGRGDGKQLIEQLSFLPVKVVIAYLDVDCANRLGRDDGLEFLVHAYRNFVRGVNCSFPAVIAHDKKR
jgi:hypothetical protein